MPFKISFVILTWNSLKTIGMCLDSIEKTCASENIPYEIRIVDNGSCDGTPDAVRNHSVTLPLNLTCLEKNMGTTTTRNIALKESSGDIICVMDSDAAFLEGNLRNLCEKLLSDESIGIIAPLVRENGSAIQKSVKKFPSVLGKLSRIPKIVFKVDIKDFDTYDNFPFVEQQEVDCAISACWFFRREMLDKVGFLDEYIFYAPEDVDYCLRIRKKGFKILYYPLFKVLHHTQRITHRKFLSKIAFSHFFGLVYYFLKHRYFNKPKI